MVIIEDPYEMSYDGHFIRVCTVWLDTMKVLHHAVPGLSLFCSQDDHHRNKLIKWWRKLEFADSEDRRIASDLFSLFTKCPLLKD